MVEMEIRSDRKTPECKIRCEDALNAAEESQQGIEETDFYLTVCGGFGVHINCGKIVGF